MDAFVLPLDVQEATLAEVGGKGANLSQLARAGFPVPAAFFVTTAAYLAFVEDNKLQQQIVTLARGSVGTDFEESSAGICQLFAQASMPPAVTTAIQGALATLYSKDEAPIPLVVRSSATAEDLPGASFAGQQETYLNVCGEQRVLQAVKQCWSSLWTARALAYRARQGIDPVSVSLAVVVQVMIPADAAGILFTANPLSGERDEMVIDAAWGLGEAIVGGLVTPDHIIADKASGAIKQVVVAEKSVMTVPVSAGTEEHSVDGDKQHRQVLDAAQVEQLVRLARAVEAHYAAPQDIEWCLAGDELWVVQSRPITTLPPEPVRWESPIPGAKWLKDQQAAEWASEPLSPLGATTTFATMIAARQRAFPMQKAPWSALMNGWLYVRADFKVFSTLISVMGFLLRIPTGTILDGRRRMQYTWPRQLTMLEALEQIDLVNVSGDVLRAHTDRLLEALGWWWWEVTWYSAAALLGGQLIRKLHVPDLADTAILFRGNDSLLLDAERALHQVAATGDIEDYLARFGHFVESADPIHLTLRESPDLLSQHLVVARQSTIGPDERLARMRHERAEAESLVHAMRGARGFLARRLLKAGQSFAAHVDDSVFHFQRVLALLRAGFVATGERLAHMGILEQAEDIFFVEDHEIWAPPNDLRDHVKQRRLMREQHKRLAPPSFVPPFSDPAWVRDPLWKFFGAMTGESALGRGPHEINGKQIVVGSPGSPGRARGIARVITGPDDFRRFQPGDVLVAHTTTPIWTPLFNIASAAVTEVGGPFSHAAIVAREFGIPLVNGALDATRVIADGMPVLVDGSAGTVEM